MKLYDALTPDLSAWILEQPVFFVASAPSNGRHVNLSPKGRPASSLALLSSTEAAYLDATGSGNETISHVRENGRLTVMLCSFGPAPRILRLFTTARVIEWDEPEFPSLMKRMDLPQSPVEGARAIIFLDIFTVQTSCGYGVPRLALQPDGSPYLQDRDTMGHWARNKIEKNELLAYHVDKNSESMDNLPGLRSALRTKRSPLFVDLSIWSCRHRRHIELFAAAVMGCIATLMSLWMAGAVFHQ
jgi:hypothetical protein